MNIFEIHKFQWWKYMNPIMQDVNLSEITFLQNNHMVFTFLNSYDGKFYRKLSCDQIIKCCIDNPPFENDVFAYFILDIFLYKLSKAELESSLSYYRYGYNVDPSELSDQYLVLMWGGDMAFEIICGRVEMSV